MAISLVEYEKLVLSLILNNALPSSIIPRTICSELGSDKFSIKEHKILYRIIQDIVNKGELPNIPTILLFLDEKKVKEIGGEPYLRSLNGFMNSVGIEEVGNEYKSWVKLVDVAGRCRMLGTVIKQYADKFSNLDQLLHSMITDGESNLEEFISNFLDDIRQSGGYGYKTGYDHISTLYDSELERLYNEEQGIPQSCVVVGWPQFVEYGIPRQGVLNVIAGLTGSGKTTLASLLMVGAAINIYSSGIKAHVTYNCMEDSKEEVYRRLACSLAKVDSQKLSLGTASPDEKEVYLKSLEILNMLPIYFNDEAGITSEELRLQAELLSMSKDVGYRLLGVSDYSELFGDTGKDENIRLSKIARNLHIFARDINSCEILVTQYPELNNPDQIGGMRSKQSRAIGQASKVFIEVWNLKELFNNSYGNSYFDKTGVNLPKWANKDYAYALIHKNSGGKKGRIQMTWEPNYTLFRDTKVKDRDSVFDY